MSEKSTPRRQRTWSAFGDIRRKPSDYEVVTHDVNWTLRQGRGSAFDENPSSLPNLWMRTYRDLSPFTVDDWLGFRDPEALTYRDYVTLQSEAEAKAQGVLEEYSNANAQSKLTAEWRATLRRLFTPSRYPMHGAEQIHAYFGYMAPSSYITNVAAFTAADLLRRVSLVAYRTRELQLAWPEDGFATGERDVWENDAAWQPARKAVEFALATFDWGEAFTALNLVLLPTLDDILVRQLRDLADVNDDKVGWLLLSFLQTDVRRRERWSVDLAQFAVSKRAGNATVLRKWIDRWSEQADEVALGLGSAIEAAPGSGKSAADVVEEARQARVRLHDDIGLAADRAVDAG